MTTQFSNHLISSGYLIVEIISFFGGLVGAQLEKMYLAIFE